jgi:peptidoglycan/xylan/chitin deacetylase (PgdA/CDA1 family)
MLLVLLLGGCAAQPLADRHAPPASLEGKRIAITFDDLPYANRKAPLAEVRASTARMLRILRRYQVRAVGFVNEDRLADTGRLESGIGLLRTWLNAGMELGNHNYGHVGLQETPLEDYQRAVLRGETHTRRLLAERGLRPRYYRHPFTQTGPTAEIKTRFESFLAEHGYAVAPFTIEHDDYMFSAVYDDAMARGDAAEAARVRAAYSRHLDEALDAFETMSRELFQRQIPQVLLIHANRLNADTLDETLGRLQERGYRFIPLETALRDAAYASPDGHIGRTGPSWLLRWARGLRKRTSVGGQPDPEPWIMRRYEEIIAP